MCTPCFLEGLEVAGSMEDRWRWLSSLMGRLIGKYPNSGSGFQGASRRIHLFANSDQRTGAHVHVLTLAALSSSSAFQGIWSPLIYASKHLKIRFRHKAVHVICTIDISSDNPSFVVHPEGIGG